MDESLASECDRCMTPTHAPVLWRFCYAGCTHTIIYPMRHLLALPIACIALAACAAPGAPRPAGPFTLEPGGFAEVAPGVTVTFESFEDSRCPPGVHCVWAGKLSYRFSIRRGSDAPESFTLAPGQPDAAPAALPGCRITLDEDALPEPPAPDTAITYRATLHINPPDSTTSPTTP